MLRNPHFLTAPWGDSIQQSHPVQPGTPLSPKSAILGQLRFPSGFHPEKNQAGRSAGHGGGSAPVPGAEGGGTGRRHLPACPLPGPSPFLPAGAGRCLGGWPSGSDRGCSAPAASGAAELEEMVLDPGAAAAASGQGGAVLGELPERDGSRPCSSCPSPPPRQAAGCSARYPRGSRRLSESGAGMRRGGGACTGGGGRMRSAASLPHIGRPRGEEGGGGGGGGRRSPCLLVALRPLNVEAERERFFRARFAYDPQFEYAEPVPEAVLDKYRAASDRFVAQVSPDCRLGAR